MPSDFIVVFLTDFKNFLAFGIQFLCVHVCIPMTTYFVFTADFKFSLTFQECFKMLILLLTLPNIIKYNKMQFILFLMHF